VSLLSLWRVVCDAPGCHAHIGRRAGTALAALCAARADGWAVTDRGAAPPYRDLCPRHAARRIP
jgi:hypothetical protein